MRSISTFWSASKALRHLTGVLLAGFIVLSFVIFAKAQTPFFTGLVLICLFSSLLTTGQRRLPLLYITLFLTAHTALFIFFVSSLNLYTTLLLFTVTSLATIQLELGRQLDTAGYVAISLALISGFLVASFLPASLLVLSLLSSLISMVVLPILVESTIALPRQLMHAGITGILGAGVLAASAIMFI